MTFHIPKYLHGVTMALFTIMSSAHLSAAVPGTAEATRVRVALATDVAQLQLEAAAVQCGLPPLTAAAPDDQTLNRRVTITAAKAGFLVNEEFFLGTHLTCRAADGVLFLGGLPTGNDLHITRSSDASTAFRLTAVEEMPIERYLLGVMTGEMQAKWPLETLRAQAVAARSYVTAKLRATTLAGRPYDVVGTVDDQVYRPTFVPPPTIAEAVASTSGEVLLQKNARVLKAYFHSCCGGKTVAAETVWGPQASQGLHPVHDDFCRRTPHRSWKIHLSHKELTQQLEAAGYITPSVTAMRGVGTPATRGWTAISLGTTGDPLEIDANTFRRIVGYSRLKSTWFAIRPTRSGWTLRGRGFGHGAGMCQWGAKQMGERGTSYRKILQFYYPGTTIGLIH